MTEIKKYQQLSLKESGKFDTKFHQKTESGFTRIPTTGWSVISLARHKAGISRKARIKGGKA